MSAVQANSAVRVLAEGYEPLAVCNVGGRFFLIADTCSHGLASLSEGDIEGGQIFCPFHGGSFDIATGKPVERPASIPIPTYPLIEIGGDLFVAAKT
ncbi:MAG: non-heme iron oxygenase ferredoxin subunit [Rhodospirillaceae bacterium]|nr:non-heme iron oxygenase ferredoxin subunit [Rhodospirillaceae bacterium]